MVTFYVTMFIENTLLASVSISALKSGGFWFYEISILVIWGGFAVGFVAMMLYYKFFHIRFVKQSLIEVNFEYLHAGNAAGGMPHSSHAAYYSANSNSIRNRPASSAAGLQEQLSDGQQWIQLSARENPLTDASSKIATLESIASPRPADVRMGEEEEPSPRHQVQPPARRAFSTAGSILLLSARRRRNEKTVLVIVTIPYDKQK